MKLPTKTLVLMMLLVTITYSQSRAQSKALPRADSIKAAFMQLKGVEFGTYAPLPYIHSWHRLAIIPNPPEHNFVVEHYNDDTLHILVLRQFVFLDTAKPRVKPAKEKIYDVLSLYFDGEQKLLVSEWCQYDGKDDKSIIALVNRTDTEFLEEVIRAWRVDPQTKTFVEISPRGIRCLNMGYGC